MPDEFTPLFADLRGRAIPQVQAPGAVAAHQTVRRRRVATSMVTGTAAALILAAGATFAGTQRGPDRDQVPAASPSESINQSVSVAGSLVPGATHVNLVASNAEPVFADVAQGRYRLSVGCLGSAPLPLKIVYLGAVQHQDTVACSDDGVVRDYEFALTRSGVVSVRFDMTAQADVYAIKLTGI
ncbi:hypothetical protein [Jidongwangia harbinensis]|uniref:hypothetical protein n=1 Tax=Jidongwangia harbinensis TaxID=2878561 RepID=UPI001CD93324|nr:hypothetical protein [Jidongwangia harbinensis]MCA2213074.1 hypothetical protein [Jidongwangia harbinensis]